MRYTCSAQVWNYDWNDDCDKRENHNYGYNYRITTTKILQQEVDNMSLTELNTKYSSFPVEIREYEIGGKKYRVHSHFVGTKDIDKVLHQIALNRAIRETLSANAAWKILLPYSTIYAIMRLSNMAALFRKGVFYGKADNL